MELWRAVVFSPTACHYVGQAVGVKKPHGDVGGELVFGDDSQPARHALRVRGGDAEQHIIDGRRGEGGGVDKQRRNCFNGKVAREISLLFLPFGQVIRDFTEATDDELIGHIQP